MHFVPAVLAAGAAEQTAFMSDEAMESVPGLKPIQYTAKHYDLYLGKMVERTEKLNKGKLSSKLREGHKGGYNYFFHFYFVVLQGFNTDVFYIVDLPRKI